jgi:hypothetical protein
MELMETSVLLEPLPLWAKQWQRPEAFGNPAL